MKILYHISSGILLFLIFNISVAESKNLFIHCEKVKIRKGDTLAGLCRKHLNKYDRSICSKVLELNPGITNPNLIYAGQVICIPVLNSDFSGEESLPASHRFPDASETKTDKPLSPKKSVAVYPPDMPGSITSLKWLDDNTAIVEGRTDSDAQCVFYVFVPGDLEYEQAGLEKPTEGTFRVRAIIGRQGQDYGKTFILKLALFNSMQERIGEITRAIIRQPHEIGKVIWFGTEKGQTASGSGGWKGIEEWMNIQGLDAMQADNAEFRIPGGYLVVNYRYMGYNPDERYLSRYGRVTLYGSSCIAKALLLRGNIRKAEAVLRVWANLTGPDGKIPRSANVIGDNYISPDVRTGEIAHFLGALAMARKLTGSKEWDEPIRNIVLHYIIPLQNQETGLVQGGYNGIGSEGYAKPAGYEKITWCSAEHNFDLFQALLLLSRTESDSDFRNTCRELYLQIGQGTDRYLWDQKAGTFNRGWRPEGPDRARALDCSSWGALYFLKQAALAKENGDQKSRSDYLKKARACLNYAENHFKTRWNFRTPDGKTGSVSGYRPYDGMIDDLRYEDGSNAGEMINWDGLTDMVWSEGTLGVAKAWEEYARETGDRNAEKRYQAIYRQMINLQKLSDKGGMLYSTKQIKGHFTMGEELASLGWMGYLTDPGIRRKNEGIVKWMPW